MRNEKQYYKKSLLENFAGFITSASTFGSKRNQNIDYAGSESIDKIFDEMTATNLGYDGDSGAVVNNLRSFFTTRDYLIKEYDNLDPSDSIISAALDQYADSVINITTTDEEGNRPYKYVSGSESDRDIIEEVFTTSKVNKDLWVWARHLCKYGEAFLVINKIDGVLSIKLEINSRKYMKIRLNNKTAIFDTEHLCFVDTDPSNLEEEPGEARKKYATLMKVEDIRVIHLNLSSRTDACKKIEIKLNSLKVIEVEHLCGTSILDPVLVVTRILRLIEDTLMMTRIEKSKITRLYEIEVGNMDDKSAKKLVDTLRKLMSGREALSTVSKNYEKSSVSKILNEIIVPVKNGVGSVKIEDVNSVFDAGDMKDLDYFQIKLYAGLKIPKVYLGYEEDTPSSLGGNPLTKVESRYGKSVRRITSAVEEGLNSLVVAIFDMKDSGDLRELENKPKKKAKKKEEVEIQLYMDMSDEELSRAQNLEILARSAETLIGVITNNDEKIDKSVVTRTILKDLLPETYRKVYEEPVEVEVEEPVEVEETTPVDDTPEE